VDITAVARFWFSLAALGSGVAAVSVTLAIDLGRHRRLATTWVGFLSAIWIILFSFAIFEFSGLVGDPVWLEWIGQVVNGAGSLTYMFVAPFFYHAVLGAPVTRWIAVLYRFVASITICGVLLLFVPAVRSAALIVLNGLLFLVVLYGIALIALQYRRIPERSLRRAILVFVGLSAVFFPPMYVESAAWLGQRALGAATHLALPTFYLILTILAVPFARSRIARPAYLVDGRVSTEFAEEFGISAREREVLDKVAAGFTNRQIAKSLYISPKTVENHLGHLFAKTATHNRTQLVTFLFANQ
jgi:DNA-binding CsgD family transcriptional regulator